MLKITGLEEFSKKLDDLAVSAAALDGEHTLPMSELLTPEFVSKHTRFSNVNAMFSASGYKFESQEDFAAIPDEKMDEFIRSISSFPNWREMLGEASKEWAARKLGFTND